MQIGMILAINAATIGLSLFLLWCFSIALRNASIIDIFWGTGFVLVAWLSCILGGDFASLTIVATVMVTAWGLRLSSYLAWRSRGKAEDYRYAAMREQHGKRFPWVSLVTVFGLQGLIMWIVALPLQVGLGQTLSWNAVAIIGIALWAIGLGFESVGDYQLACFKANAENSGLVMDRGLWRYTRHPNYFGDFLVWWGFYLVTVQAATWWWTLIGPLLMSWLLLRVSGVSLLERSLRYRVAGYDDYLQRTSSFFPWPPTRSPAND